MIRYKSKNHNVFVVCLFVNIESRLPDVCPKGPIERQFDYLPQKKNLKTKVIEGN